MDDKYRGQGNTLLSLHFTRRLSPLCLLTTCLLAIFSSATQADCIAVALPQAQLKQGDAMRDISAPLQAELSESLARRELEAVSLPTREPEQLTLQATQAECSQILFTELKHKKKSRWNKLFSIGLSVGSHHSGGSVGVGVSTTIGDSSKNTGAGRINTNTLDDAQRLIGGGDTVTLSYELKRVDGQGLTGAHAFKLKSGYDGEDILSPLIENVSAATFSNLAD